MMPQLICLILTLLWVTNPFPVHAQHQRVIYQKDDNRGQVQVKVRDKEPIITQIKGSVLKVYFQEGNAILLFSAVDGKNEPIKDLTQKNFDITVYTNGVAHTIKSSDVIIQTRSKENPLVSIILRDTSGSINASLLSQVNAGISAYIDLLSPGDVAQITDFGSRLSIVHPFTSDKGSLQRALKIPGSGGSTKFYDGLWYALQQLQLALYNNSVKVILAYTDGVDTTSEHSLKEVIHQAQLLSIPIYSIGTGDADEKILEALSQETGGLYFYAERAEDLTPIYNQIMKILNASYRMIIPANVQAGDEFSVQITCHDVQDGKKKTNQFVVGQLKVQ